jgi:hypothetical protein
MYPYGNSSPGVQLTFIYLLYKNVYIISQKHSSGRCNHLINKDEEEHLNDTMQ